MGLRPKKSFSWLGADFIIMRQGLYSFAWVGEKDAGLLQLSEENKAETIIVACIALCNKNRWIL
jgi:hypothetical protein